LKTLAKCLMAGAFALAAAPRAVRAEGQATLPPTALFSRCYAHLTHSRLPLGQAAARLGSQNAVDACMSLLDRAALQTSGPAVGRLANESDAEAKNVLKTLNDFHRTWFPADDIIAGIPEDEARPWTEWLFDGGEPALHVTRALLSDGVKYSEVLTGTSGVEALRSGGEAGNPALPGYVQGGGTVNDFKMARKAGDESAGVESLGVPPIQYGDLLGARRIAGNNPKTEVIAVSASDVGGFYGYNPAHNYTEGFFHQKSHGGGILGTKAYLMLNLGRNDIRMMDGGLRMPRRWSKALLNDLLCRNIPAIRPGDAVLYTQTGGGTKTPPFRVNRQCMQCHATLDPMAATARNLSFAFLPYRGIRPQTAGLESMAVMEWAVTLPREAGQVDQDDFFYRRPPFGRVLYRGHDGRLVAQEVNGIAGLGEALANQDEPYVCAANRYFFFFTGILANIQEPGADGGNVSALSAVEKGYRDFVIKLGQELKQDPQRNLKALIRKIIASEYYQKASMRAAGDPAGGQ